MSRLLSRSGSSRALSPLGIIGGLVIFVIGLALFLLGYAPGSVLGLHEFFAPTIEAILLDLGGIALMFIGAIVAWRF